MSGKTKIEWADRVWNPTVGCTPVSEKLPLPAQKRDGYMSDSSELVHVYPSPNYDRAVCYLHYLEKWSCSAEVTPAHWRPIDLPEVER